MSKEYADAVEWLKRLLAPHYGKGKRYMGRHEPREIFFRYALRIIWTNDASGGRYVYPPEALFFLAEHCEEDRAAFDLLAGICAAHVMRGELIPEAAKSFAVLSLAGQIERPKESLASKTYLENLYLYAAAEACSRRFGLKLSRNDAAKTKESACDAVADALSVLGYGKSARAIQELFFNPSHSKLRESVSQLRNLAVKLKAESPELVAGWVASIGFEAL